MKVLLVHNHYKQPGGEDQVFASEARLLERQGHRVLLHTVHNDAVDGQHQLTLAAKTVWNSESYRALRRLIRKERPEVMHVHNTMPLLSPAVYFAAKDEGVPVIQTLHNYRLLCPGAFFFRDGAVCERCLHKAVAWPGVVHACYRDSKAASGVVAAMLAAHRLAHTWTDKVDYYIALTEFARQKFIEGGLAARKIVVKPNFLDDDPGIGRGQGGYVLFVGRLSHEKGLETLLEAWKMLSPRIPLKIVGDGPMASYVAKAVEALEGVEWLGLQPRDRVLAMMKEAALLIIPSMWYEGCPLTIIEAYAVGAPVIASRLGSMSSMIKSRRTGLFFNPGDPEDLARQVEWVLMNAEILAFMRRSARMEFETQYSAARNYEMLMAIYKRAIEPDRTGSVVHIPAAEVEDAPVGA